MGAHVVPGANELQSHTHPSSIPNSSHIQIRDLEHQSRTNLCAQQGERVASPGSAAIVAFGEFEVKLSSRELCRNGARVRLPDQSFQILAMLLERPGELVSREDIRQRLWPGRTFVDFDHGLNNAMNRLREALGDSAESPRFIETLPRRGYRFIAPIQPGVALSADLQPSTAPAADTRASEGESTTLANDRGPASETKKVSSRKQPMIATVVVVVLSIFGAGLYWSRMRVHATPIQSLAVLPLENVSGDAGQDYFADGMTDALITRLAGIHSVRVISRTSAMHYKGTRKSLPEIARELHVDAIVEGTVSKSGSRIRINAQLIDANADQHLWAKQYDGELRDVLQLQNDIAAAIASEVAGRMTPKDVSSHKGFQRPINPEAYESYLKGEYFLEKWTTDGFEMAKRYFEHAIELDSSYADAYTGLAEYYATVAFMSIVPPREAWLKAEGLVARSLQIDDSSSRAHTLLGTIKMQFRCDRVGAETELNHALQLNPTDMNALDLHSYYLLEIGRTDEAIAEKRRVLQHDPLRVITNAEMGLYLIQARRFDEAIAQLRRTLELDPNYAAAHMRLGLAYEAKQEYSQAVSEMQKAISLDMEPARLADLGEVYGRWGKRQEALEILRQLEDMSKNRYVSPTMRAIVYAGLGENESAIMWLEKATRDDSPELSAPGFDVLRADPRFKGIERQLTLNHSCQDF